MHPPDTIHAEAHLDRTGTQLNWLRAAVLGANDGVVSVSSIVAGVAAASDSAGFILTAGIAGLTAGALSMAVGEYVSVSTQRDTERALLEKERGELRDVPEKELEELIGIYEAKGLTRATAEVVARELSAKDAFAAHVDAELGIDPNALTNPWHAAYASAIAFCVGGIIPILAIIFSPAHLRIPLMFSSVILALIITGTLSAYVGGANKTTAAVRVVFGGILAMVITFGIGRLFGVTNL